MEELPNEDDDSEEDDEDADGDGDCPAVYLTDVKMRKGGGRPKKGLLSNHEDDGRARHHRPTCRGVHRSRRC